jgi:hypothetical protein
VPRRLITPQDYDTNLRRTAQLFEELGVEDSGACNR